MSFNSYIGLVTGVTICILARLYDFGIINKILLKLKGGKLGIRDSSREVTNNDKLNFEDEHEQILIREQLTRNYSFLGDEKMDLIKSSSIIVVGLGGVGSWASIMLARSGIGKLKLIDFDNVTLSSLNRHSCANREDVGLPKAQVLKNHIIKFAPFVDVEAAVEMFCIDKAKQQILNYSPDYVLDCIDNIDTKVELLLFCTQNKIKVISSMGAGTKADPTHIQIADLRMTIEDPLSRAVRRRLKKLNVEEFIPTVYSTEKPTNVKLLPLEDEKYEDRKQYSILPDFRVRILPVLGTIPAMFGIAMCSYVICQLTDYKIKPLAYKNRKAIYAKIHKDAEVYEKNTYQEKDIGYIVEEIWHGKSAISQSNDKLCLSRWNIKTKLTIENCVLMTKKERTVHQKLKEDEKYNQDVYEYVNQRLQEERLYSKWTKTMQLPENSSVHDIIIKK